MSCFDVIRGRRSIRAYEPKPLDEAKLEYILQAANAAPSAGNLQAYEMFLVRNPVHKKALADAAFGQNYIENAPVLIVFAANPARNTPKYGDRGKRLYALQDATIACSFAMLAATELGLGTVWVGAFDDDSVRKLMGLPASMTPVAILPVGYAAEKPAKTPRRPLRMIVHEL